MQSFLEGPKAALVASKDFDNGHYNTTPQHGIRAFGRVYSAWAYGQTVLKVFLVDITPSDTEFTVVPRTPVPLLGTVRSPFLHNFSYSYNSG
jgi:hypothetical protein